MWIWKSAGVLLLLLVIAASASASSAGPVGHWTLDEGSGLIAADSSGYGDSGTISGDARWAPGRFASALEFDGADGEVRVPDSSALEPASAVTVAAWVQHAGSPGSYRYVLAKGASGCTAAAYGLYTGVSGGLQFYIARESGSVYFTSADAGASVWDGRWHFVAGTFDGTTVRLFVDGNEVGAGTVSPGLLEYGLAANDLFIGNYPTSGSEPDCQAGGFVGVIDDVTIWGRALSPGEIQSAAAGAPTQPTGPTPPGSRGAPSPGGSGSAPPPRPGSARSLRFLTIAPPVFVLHRDPGTRKRQRIGATISYTATKAGRSTLTVLLAVRGTLVRGRCTPLRRRRGRRLARLCTLYEPVGSFFHLDVAGRNRVRFTGLRHRRLPPGAYRLMVRPTGLGRVGVSLSAAFRVLG